MYVISCSPVSYFSYTQVEIPGQRHNMPSGSRPQAAQAAFQSPADVNSSSSTREHEIKRFFSWMRSSLDKKEKKGVPRSRGTPEVVDVPLAPATYVCSLQLYPVREI